MKSHLAGLAGAAALALSGLGHAAIVVLEQSLTLAQPAGPAAIAADSGGSLHGGGFFELVVDPSWTEPTRFTSLRFDTASGALSYALYTDLDGAIRSGDTGTLLASWSQPGETSGDDAAFYTYLLGAGQYVLEIGTGSEPAAVATGVSEVPLPGAAWLFGSGLLAFLWISGRHKL